MKTAARTDEPVIHVPQRPEVVTLHYRVHGLGPLKQEATVEFAGQKVKAEVSGVEVELTCEDSPTRHGSVTLRFVGTEADRVVELLPVGSEVNLVLRLP